MELYLEAETREERRIKAYLEANASGMLAEKINNGVRIQKDGRTLLNKKTLKGFMKYAAEEAKKLAGKGRTLPASKMTSCTAGRCITSRKTPSKKLSATRTAPNIKSRPTPRQRRRP